MILAKFGSISTGTLNDCDLMVTFENTLSNLEDERYMNKDRPADLLELSDLSPDEVSKLNDWVWDDLAPMLEEHAPPFSYFGAHPGDGSDIGFWLDMDIAIFDGTLLVIPGLANVEGIYDPITQKLWTITASHV